MTNEPPELRPHGDPMRDRLVPDEVREKDEDTSPADIPAPGPIDEVGADDDPGAGAD
jgi:hypothetical protein